MNSMIINFLILTIFVLSNVNGISVADAYRKQMMEFWTEERINAAIPKSLMIEDSRLAINKNAKAEHIQKPIVIPGTSPTSHIISKRVGYPNTVGKVFFVDDSSMHSCSASVVTADNKDLIITAAHCVYSIKTLSYVKNFIFIPKYDNSSNVTRPFGTWVARSLHVLPEWIKSRDLNADVGVVLLDTLNGQHIQDVVGSHGIAFHYSQSGWVDSFGYPVNYKNGQTMTSCSGTKYSNDSSSYTGAAMPCNMTNGASGGPWLESFSFSNFTGIQTSVNSHKNVFLENIIFGPYFGSSVESLYNKVKGNATYSSGVQHVISASLFLLCLLQCFQYLFFILL